MFCSTSDLRNQFLTYLHQSESCELFYNYMKSEQLAYLLEFYLACDGLKNLAEEKKPHRTIIELIYKHYLSTGKSLSSKQFSLPCDILSSIKQRLARREFHPKFYEQAQDYVLKYMLQMCYPKFLIEQRNTPVRKRQALNPPLFSAMHRRCAVAKKKNAFDKFRQQANSVTTPMHKSRTPPINPSSLEQSACILDYTVGVKQSKASLTTSTKACDLAQRNPAAFFEQVRRRLLVHHTDSIDHDSFAVLDLQIAQTIDDADHCLEENRITHRPQPVSFTRHDSGVETERNYEVTCPPIDVVWYSSLDNDQALLSTISRSCNPLTFQEFRRLFKRHNTCRYFFKTVCSSDINKEQYVYRELTMDDELVPFYEGKIFVRLDRLC